jgi:hypothetical protein
MKSSDVAFMLKVLKKTARTEVMDHLNSLPPDSDQWFEIFLKFVYPARMGVRGRASPWILTALSTLGALVALIL